MNTETNAGIYYLRLITLSGDYYYIGQTRRSFAQRWREHVRDLRLGQHANAQLQKLYRDGAVIVAGVIVALKTTISKQRIEMIEQQAIAQAKRRGLRVVNVVTGESQMREEKEEE
jgi:hypothetical protein